MLPFICSNINARLFPQRNEIIFIVLEICQDNIKLGIKKLWNNFPCLLNYNNILLIQTCGDDDLNPHQYSCLIFFI